jgi:hypothetical protein
MPPTNVWTLQGPASLIERGNALLGDTPLELSNSYMLSEGVVQMRQGFSSEDYSASLLDGPVEWIGRHVTNEGIEEAFAASNNAGTAELGHRVGGAWGPATFSDTAAAANLRFMDAVTQNGKYFMCYDSNVNRLHVWDGTSVRRVGLGMASAVTAATMGGAGLTFNRWYRKRVVVQASGIVVRRSEPSPTYVNVSITDDAGVTVTRGTVPGEGETHWELEASTSSGGAPTVWYRIATVAIATLTSNDTNSAISTFDLSDVLGLYLPPPSAKYIVSDGAVLVMGGCWETAITAAGETTPKQNRVWFTRPLGSSDISDDESIPDVPGEQQNYIDVGDAGPITGIVGPVSGEIYVFKAASIFKLVPTGDLTTPYARVLVSPSQGAVDQRIITEGDLGGTPAVYFADQTALYAMAAGGGVQCVSEGIARDLRQTEIGASDSFLAFDPFQRILLFQVSSSPEATTGTYRSFTFDTAKQRWSGFELGGAISGWVLGVGVLGVTTVLGGTGASIINGSYLEDPNGGRRTYLCGQTATDTGALFVWAGQVGMDASHVYTTTARYRRAFAALTGRAVTIGAPTVWYRNPQGDTVGDCTLLVSFIRNNDETRSQTVTLTATPDDNGIAVQQVTLESLASADVSTLDVRLYLSYSGTAFISVTTPTVDAITIPFTVQEPLAR